MYLTVELTFEIECDTSRIKIEDFLTHDQRSLMYFNEKLNGVAMKYPTYDKELYVLVKELDNLTCSERSLLSILTTKDYNI